jgi:hypothetical protein
MISGWSAKPLRERIFFTPPPRQGRCGGIPSESGLWYICSPPEHFTLETLCRDLPGKSLPQDDRKANVFRR